MGMRCQQCDSDNPVASRYCATCGARLEIVCVQCGHGASPADEFCSWCGATMRVSPGRSGPGGERKQATVLFADIVGSTHMIASLDAEEAMGRLRPVLAAMAQAVRRFDGTIIRSLGDGLKASFGAPRALEGHALLACKAALAMQEAVAALQDAPPIRIGLHSGEVVAGELDTGSAVERETVGVTVHLASRIEQLAEPGGIWLSQACRLLVRSYCDTIPVGVHAVKGFAEPVEVHRLLGLKQAVASEQFRGTELTQFMGRDDELALLQRALAAAERGEASAIGISAPPGVGKSRLCYEFTEWCRRRHIDVLEARAFIYAHATPMQPVLEMLRSFFRLSPLDEGVAAREAIAQRVLALDPSFEADLPLLTDFLGVGDPEKPISRQDPRLRHAALRDIVRRIVRGVGQRPSVIIVEDLHWLDEASADFVETIVDAVAGSRIVLVLNFRPSYEADWMMRPYYRELPLAELARSDIRGMVRTLAGGEPGLEAISAQVADRSGGNPFFAEELVKSLADSGVLVGERGKYRLGASGEQAQLPATVEAVVGARIDRLQEGDKSLLQIGAVIGKEFPLVVLQQVAAIPAPRIEAALARLCDAGLVQEQASIAGRSFAFRHPLIQEVAYAMQLRARRTGLHDAVAKAIERFEWGQLDEFAGLLAYHCEAAGLLLDAAVHLQRAARWLGKSNSSEAFKHWKKVRWLLRDQPTSVMNDRMRALASGQILSFGWREGMDADEAKPYADEALRYARAGGDEMQPPLLLGAYGRILAASAPADDYVAVIREALSLTSTEGDAGRTATVNGMLGQAYYLAGLLHEALAANDAALAAIADMDADVTLGMNVNQLLGFDIEQWIRCYRTMILVRLGRFEEAETWLARVLQIDPGRVDYVVQFIPHVASVEIAWRRGDAPTAQRHASKVLEYAQESAVPYIRAHAASSTALAKSTAGDFAGASADLRAGIDFARKARAGRELEPRMMAELAEARYRAGDVRNAIEVSDEALDMARRRAHRLVECHASAIRALALVDTGEGDGQPEAGALMDRAEELLVVTGGKIFEPLLRHARLQVETRRQ